MTAATDTRTSTGLLDVLGAILAAAVLAAAIVAGGSKAIAGLAGLLLFAAFLYRPVLGLYLTTALLLLSGSATIWGDLRLLIPITASKAVGFLAFIAWLTRAIVLRERIRLGKPSVVLLAFFAWAALGVALSRVLVEQWAEWFRMGTLVAYFILAVNVLSTRSRIRTFVALVLVCGLAMAVFAIAQYFLPALQLEVETAAADIGQRAEGALVEYGDLQSGAIVRVSGGTGHSNWLALLILMVMPLNVYWFMTAKRRLVKALAAAAVLLELTALILTFTRTGFLVGLTVLGILALRQMVRLTPARIAAILLAVFIGWFFLPEGYRERVLSTKHYTTYNQAVQNRLDMQAAAWDMFTQSPLYGVGLGGFGPLLLEDNTRIARTMTWFVDEHDWPPQFIGAHNMYLQLLSETGLVGLGFMLALFAVILVRLRRIQRRLREAGDNDGLALAIALEIGLLAFLFSAIFLHALQQKILWMMLAVAAVAPLYLEMRNGKDEELGEEAAE